MYRLRINEAIAMASMKGNKIKKKDLSAKLWPETNEKVQQVSMTRLCSGYTKFINPEWVVVLCKVLDCSADFLFGIENED